MVSLGPVQGATSRFSRVSPSQQQSSRGGCPTQASSPERSWFTRTKRTARSARAGDAVELDGDHAFGDCGSRRPVKAASKNPCRMRGNYSSTEASRGTSGCYVERPARVDSTSLAEAPPVEQAREPLGRHGRCFASWRGAAGSPASNQVWLKTRGRARDERRR